MGKSYIFLMLLISSISLTSLHADVNNGANLFQGTKHFENGAAACIACHSVNSALVSDGGKIAMDLTMMSGAGIEYAIAKPQNASSPFMQKAFIGKELTASEKTDLFEFFDKIANDNAKANVASNNAKANNVTKGFILKGIIGAIILFILLSLLGKNRKKQSVNQEIYDRQLKSSWREVNK